MEPVLGSIDHATTAPGGLVRRLAEPVPTSGPGAWTGHDGGAEMGTSTGGVHLPGDALEALVDAVVERIEARVVDELERRGRRQDWGVL